MNKKGVISSNTLKKDLDNISKIMDKKTRRIRRIDNKLNSQEENWFKINRNNLFRRYNKNIIEIYNTLSSIYNPQNEKSYDKIFKEKSKDIVKYGTEEFKKNRDSVATTNLMLNIWSSWEEYVKDRYEYLSQKVIRSRAASRVITKYFGRMKNEEEVFIERMAKELMSDIKQIVQVENDNDTFNKTKRFIEDLIKNYFNNKYDKIDDIKDKLNDIILNDIIITGKVYEIIIDFAKILNHFKILKDIEETLSNLIRNIHTTFKIYLKDSGEEKIKNVKKIINNIKKSKKTVDDLYLLLNTLHHFGLEVETEDKMIDCFRRILLVIVTGSANSSDYNLTTTSVRGILPKLHYAIMTNQERSIVTELLYDFKEIGNIANELKVLGRVNSFKTLGSTTQEAINIISKKMQNFGI